MNLKCIDPCPGICGLNAMCRAVNHNPICTCLPGYDGDPFDRCSLIPEPSKPNNYYYIVLTYAYYFTFVIVELRFLFFTFPNNLSFYKVSKKAQCFDLNSHMCK